MHWRLEGCTRGRAARAAGTVFLLCALAPAHANPAPRWEIRDASHPLLGPVRFAFTATPIATPVGISRVSSQVYVSCERETHTIALEFANSQAPGDPRGLAPRVPPKLVCKRRSRDGVVQEEIRAEWAFNELGDVLARGFRPEALQACSAIGVVQQVELPKGWSQETARLVFDVAPATPEVRSILADCRKPRDGATTASRGTALRQASNLAAAPTPAASGAPQDAWRHARTTPSGRTNVRAAASTEANVVGQVAPNAAVLVRKGAGEWWRVKTLDAEAVEGYVRKDRLILR